jgi:hypothetical protein
MHEIVIATEWLIKNIGAPTVIIGGLWTLTTFSFGRRDLSKTRLIEAQKPFNEKRLQYYLEATSITSTIATSENDAVVIAAKARFWALYWGELALFEDDDVEDAMVKFGTALETGHTDKLREWSLTVAHACRSRLSIAGTLASQRGGWTTKQRYCRLPQRTSCNAGYGGLMAEIQIEFSGPAAMLVPVKLNDTNTFEAGKTKEIPGGAVIRFLPRRKVDRSVWRPS